MIPQETINRILDSVQIADVIGDFITLKRNGANYQACCPFHNEKTPSFSVSPSKGLYKCFGCGKAGSAVTFLMDYEHISYTEALKYLAKKYNIDIVEKEESAEDIAARQRNESLMIVSEFAGKFFVNSLATDEGRHIGLAYFKSRGLQEATIAKYGLGWAPKSRKGLVDAAKSAGYKEEYLEETGLCVKYDDGTFNDRFYERVVFPIHSVSGRVIAFGGRTLKSDHTVAKYVNSKESEIYVKSRSLYGIYFAKNEIAKRDKCYLVEGYLDVLSMHQLGILNVVASSGTSLTVEQIRLIKRFTSNITIMYDGDSAGIHAALRGIGMVLKEGMNVKVVLIPDGDDPDSYSRKHSLEEVQEFIVSNEKDFIEFKTDLLISESENDPLKRANLINDIADTIAEIPDPVKRSVYAQVSSKKLNIEQDIVVERIKKTHKKLSIDAIAEAKRVQHRLDYEQGLKSLESEERSKILVNVDNTTPTKSFLYDIENNHITGNAERDLLYFLLNCGTETLDFPSDSEFYAGKGEEKFTVAVFIYDAIGDGEFLNNVYREVYNLYMEMYDKGFDQEHISKILLNHADDKIRLVATELSIDKYIITVKKFADALTTPSSWLVNYVPKAILVYHSKHLENRLQDLRNKMNEERILPDKQSELLKEFVKTQNLLTKIKIKIGREKNNNGII